MRIVYEVEGELARKVGEEAQRILKELGKEDVTVFIVREFKDYPEYVAMHKADEEGSKIYVRLVDDFPLLRAALYHEAAHSILHGSPKYYRFSVSECLEFLSEYNRLRALYLIAVAVKDYEVARFLKEKGLQETQRPLVALMSVASRTEQEAWRLSKGDEESRALLLAAFMKTFFYVVPLGGPAYLSSYSFLGEHWNRLYNLTLKLPEILGEDTHENVEKVSCLLRSIL